MVAAPIEKFIAPVVVNDNEEAASEDASRPERDNLPEVVVRASDPETPRPLLNFPYPIKSSDFCAILVVMAVPDEPEYPLPAETIDNPPD